MDIFQAIIIGIIEGFTEFLPISSTGHMIVASKFMGIEESNLMKAYEVIIQFSAILAVAVIYRDKFHISHLELWKKLILAFLPLAIVGFLLKDYIKMLFSVEVVAVMFIVGGVIFLIVEKFHKEKEDSIKNIDDITYKQAFIIGLAQILSLIPGTSRAGATIIGGLLVGLNREMSASFSFLLAIPVMSAVSGYDLLKHYQDFSNINILPFVIGFIVSFIVAYITIKLFLAFLHRFTFVIFGIYRIIFGIILLSL
ncbi:Undecaprenyl-diphosphatase [hydrothermal vent metagenome]|uniref:Undecaprenyl-diphosphatase n=1 Tax=hydrothermal vent metagenome TaxID=652676 RepID=A0A1W1C242_9ZZZZ